MEVFVITCEHSKDRQDYIKKELDGIEFNFFVAENIKENCSHEIYDLYHPNKTKKWKGYQLTTGELGCFASHRSLWDYCVNQQENILVLEDNIELCSDLKSHLVMLNKLASQYGMIKLFNAKERKYKCITRLKNGYQLISLAKEGQGTSGYVISPQAARKYLVKTEGFFEAVDDFIENEWRTKQTICSYYPYLVRRRLIPSVIGVRKLKTKKRVDLRILAECYRCYKKIRQMLYHHFCK